MIILVTGGCGFIGSNFIKHMLDKYDYEITNLDSLTYAGNRDNLGEYENHHNYYFAQGDINETDFLKVIIETKEIDTIVNFAAESHVDRSIVNPDDFIKSNIDGTYNLLRLLHEYPMKKFIQISTDEVYGSLQEDDEAFTEKTSIFPSSPYAASKASADLLCFSFFHTHNYPIIVTRCSNNYGPNQYPEKLIPLMIQKAKNNERLPVYGNGKNIRDWVHVKDHCEAIDLVLHEGRNGEVYNIGGEEEKRNLDIVHTILDGLGKSHDLIDYVEDRKGHDWRYAMDISKIRNELGWTPKMKFEDGIKELLNENIHNS